MIPIDIPPDNPLILIAGFLSPLNCLDCVLCQFADLLIGRGICRETIEKKRNVCDPHRASSHIEPPCEAAQCRVAKVAARSLRPRRLFGGAATEQAIQI